MKEYKVYCLVDPVIIKVRYIGITKRRLGERLSSHICDVNIGREANTYKFNWIRSLLKINSRPLIKLLASFDTRQEAANLETLLIEKYKKSHRLTNGIIDEGKFYTNGSNFKETRYKKLYVYNHKGEYIRTFNSRVEAIKTLNVTKRSIDWVLKGKLKFSKQYQFSNHFIEHMPDITQISKYHSKEVFIKDNVTGIITRYPSIRTATFNLLNRTNSTEGIKGLRSRLKTTFQGRYTIE